MSEITNSKTWTKIHSSVSSGVGTNRTLIRNIKDDLIIAGFSHVSSYDSINTNSSVDLWDSDSDIVWSGTSVHSWIVLSHSGIVSGLQICIDLNYNDSAAVPITVWATMSSGFSGGTTSVRPTASDEIKISEGATCYWGNAGTAYSRQYNLFYCEDSIRIYLAYNGTTPYGFWHFDKIENTPGWLTYPIVLKVGNNSSTAISRSSFTSSSGFSFCFIEGNQVKINFGGTYVGTTAVQDLVSLNSGDYNGSWPVSEILIISNVAFCPGVFGYISDMWHVVDDLADFDYFPGDGSKEQVVLQDIAQGSDGSTVSW